MFDYIDGGAEDELSLRRNVAAFRRAELVPRVLRDVSGIDLSATLLGRQLPMPLVVAPTGFTRIASPGGELDVSRAAAGPACRTRCRRMATRSIEEVAAVSRGPKWLQVYVWRDRGLVKELLSRAAQAGYEAIAITVDTAVLGRRERDVRRGFTMPPQLGPGTLIDGLLHPGWTWAFARAEPITFSNVSGSSAPADGRAVNLAEYTNSQFDPALSWRDLDWFRAEWDGPIVLKGIQSVADARLAADAGVEAIALSNHGGRQLDGSPAILELVAAGRRRGRRPGRDHLRRRRPPRQRHRQGGRARRARLHGRPGVPVRAGRGGERGVDIVIACSRRTCGGPWR